MSFSLPRGLRDFVNFKDQRVYYNTDRGTVGGEQMILFDGFYACLLLGILHTGLGKPETVDETDTFPAGYPNTFKSFREYIAALLVQAELRRTSTEDYGQNEYERAISKLLQVDAPTGLSEDGIKLANLYAAGGFAFLATSMRPKPANAVNFLLRFHDLCTQEGILDERA